MFMTTTAKLKNHKIYGLLLMPTMLIVIAISPVMSSLSGTATIGSSGTIMYSNTASSPTLVFVNSFGYDDVLYNNLAGLCNTCKAHAVKYVAPLVGYWDMSGSTVQLNYNNGRSASFYQNVATQLKAAGLSPIAWLLDGWTYDSAHYGQMNLGSSYWSQYEAHIKTIMDLGFDGFCEDIENWVGMSWADRYNFDNHMTTYLHNGANFADGLPRLNMPCVGTYQGWNLNKYLICDYILVMFYGGTTYLSDPLCNTYWQEILGVYSGGTPGYPSNLFTPASPIIVITMSANGDPYCYNDPPYDTMLGQISKYNTLLTTYSHPKLYSFGIWVYETMGSSDWAPWDTWIESTLPTMGVPPS